jgi:hypothetical protein
MCGDFGHAPDRHRSYLQTVNLCWPSQSVQLSAVKCHHVCRMGPVMMSFVAKSLGLLLALAVFAFAAFSLQVNLSASESTPDVARATQPH